MDTLVGVALVELEDVADRRVHALRVGSVALDLDGLGGLGTHDRRVELDQSPRELQVAAVAHLVGVRPWPSPLVVGVVIDEPELLLAQPVALAPGKLGRVSKLKGCVHGDGCEAHPVLW